MPACTSMHAQKGDTCMEMVGTTGAALFCRSSSVLPTPSTVAPAGRRCSTFSSGASGADSTRMRAFAPWLLPVAMTPLEGRARHATSPRWPPCSGV